MRVLEAAGLRLNVSKQNFCLIDGSPLQTPGREFCLWWLRSFENAGKSVTRRSQVHVLLLLRVLYIFSITKIAFRDTDRHEVLLQKQIFCRTMFQGYVLLIVLDLNVHERATLRVCLPYYNNT